MPRCRVDPEVERVVKDGFQFPLGVYPVEEMTPKAGYSVDFEPADGDDTGEAGDWEEWPDRYVYDIVISADRLEPLCRNLLALMPGRIYPILDFLGLDAFREVDPYISYDLVGMDRFTDALRRYRGFFFEDGLCGFGVMIDEPFLYIFVDEHKIVTVRAEPDIREKIEKILQAFDLEQTESPAGADAAAHEHRNVLVVSDDRPDLLTSDEIVELLRDEWRLVLNIDPDSNVDDEGKELGIVPWHCLVRCAAEGDEKARYADVIVSAGNLRQADELALDAVDGLLPADTKEWEESTVVVADRLTQEQLGEALQARSQPAAQNLKEERIIFAKWLE